MKQIVNNVRLAFPDLYTAKKFDDDGKASFGATALIEPTDPQVKTINATIEAVAKEKWGVKAPELLKAMRAAIPEKVCLHDGKHKTQYQGFEGMLFIATRNPVRPTVVDQKKNPLVEADGKPYAGCYVNVVLDIWAQDNKFGKRVNATLMGVQFVRDGDAFSGGGAADPDDFADLGDGAGEGDLG